MTKQINLSKVDFFKAPNVIAKFNQHIHLHDDFMLHQISHATGCRRTDALEALMLLYHHGIVEMYLLIYHVDDLEIPIGQRRITEGAPEFPFMNPATEEMVYSIDELTFEFFFVVKHDIDFELIAGPIDEC